MSIWTYIKRGFGYGFGGRIGWELGGLVWSAVRKIAGVVALAVGSYVGVPALSDSLATYKEVKQRYEKPAKPAARPAHSQSAGGHR